MSNKDDKKFTTPRQEQQNEERKKSLVESRLQEAGHSYEGVKGPIPVSRPSGVELLAEKMGGSHAFGSGNAPQQMVKDSPFQVALPKELTFDEKYVRHTVYLDRKLAKRVDSIADIRRGEKTKIINRALAMYFADPENVKQHLLNSADDSIDSLLEKFDANMSEITRVKR